MRSRLRWHECCRINRFYRSSLGERHNLLWLHTDLLRSGFRRWHGTLGPSLAKQRAFSVSRSTTPLFLSLVFGGVIYDCINSTSAAPTGRWSVVIPAGRL